MISQLLEFATNHWILAGLWALVALLLVLSFVQTMMSGSRSLSAAELTVLMNRNQAQVVDLRALADFNKGHIVGSINIPMTKLEDHFKDLEKFKDKPVVMVCPNGLQSGGAVIKLRRAGFTDVHKLQNGIQGWVAENLPLRKG